MSKNDFDRLVPFYDFLKKAVFGNRLDYVSGHFLNRIKKDDSVLVLGPGSGELLKEILTIQVVALDKSEKFIEKAKSNGPGVEFVHADFLHWEKAMSFDWIVCPFFLDVFAPHELKDVIVKIFHLLAPEGKLIVTDFQVSRGFGNIITQRLMHLFFRWTVSLSSNQLQDIQGELAASFKSVDVEEFGNVFSGVYQKRLPTEP